MCEPDSKRRKLDSYRRWWPAQGRGPIDLAVHDSPHVSSQIEWWYTNSHVEGNGKQYSFFSAFFRIAVPNDQGVVEWSHAVNWALVDVAKNEYTSHSVVDASTPKNVVRLMESGDFKTDPHVARALLEIVEKGRVPLPDTLMQREAKVSGNVADDGTPAGDALHLDFEGNIFCRQPDGSYLCKVKDGEEEVELVFTPGRDVVRHGIDGVVSTGETDEDMFYYFIPRMAVTGSVKRGDVTDRVTGRGWYDHEFGGTIRSLDEQKALREAKKRAGQAGVDNAWEWAAIQLDNSMEISAAVLKDSSTGKELGSFTIVAEGESGYERHDNVSIVSVKGKEWISPKTAIKYPTSWDLTIAKAGISLRLEAAVIAQEFVTLIAKPAYWEGRVTVSGTVGGKPVTGIGFVECHGHQDLQAMDKFYEVLDGMLCDPLRGTGYLEADDAPPQPAFLKGGPKQYMIDDLIEACRGRVETDALAEMALVTGQISKPDAEKIGGVMGVLGTAFQLMETANAPRVTPGRITAPLINAISRADQTRRLEAWKWLLNAKEGDEVPPVFPEAIMPHMDAAAEDTRKQAKEYLEAQWSALEGDIPDTFYKMMLRAAAFRLLTGGDFLTQENIDTSAPDMEITTSTSSERKTCADAKEYSHCQATFVGRWVLDKAKSQSLKEILTAEGVNSVVRIATCALTPTLVSKVEDGAIRTTVHTIASTSEVITHLDGRMHKWMSVGRGEVEYTAWLENGGATCTVETTINHKGITGKEFKRLTVSNDWLKEHLEWRPDNGSVVECTRWFRKTE